MKTFLKTLAVAVLLTAASCSSPYLQYAKGSTASSGSSGSATATANVSTAAGLLTAGFVNGSLSAASFSAPAGVTGDGTTLYVADTANNAIRAVDLSSGTVTTLAGAGPSSTGSNDATGTSATFSGPQGVASDGTTVYVADTGNGKVRKISVATGTYGVVTTLATGLTSPTAVATDGTFVYVVDSTGTLYQVASDGTKTSLATGLGNAAGVATDGVAVYVVDQTSGTVYKVALSGGAKSTLITGLSSPSGVTSDGINLFVTESAAGLVKKIVLATGVVTTVTGSELSQPGSVFTDGTDLYVADKGHNQIKKVSGTPVSGATTTTASDILISSPGHNRGPSTLAWDGTFVYVPDQGTSTINKVKVSTKETSTVNDSNGPIVFANRDFLVYDSTNSVLYVLDGTTLYSVSASGSKIIVASPLPTTLAGLATDGANVYATDPTHHVVHKIAVATGTMTVLAGNSDNAGSAEGTGTSAQFNTPEGIVYDKNNAVLYVADTGNHKVRRVTKSGAVTTLVGLGINGKTNGRGKGTKFTNPTGLGLDDTNGYLYVSEVDSDHGDLRKVNTTTLDVDNYYAGTDVKVPMCLLGLPGGAIVDDYDPSTGTGFGRLATLAASPSVDIVTGTSTGGGTGTGGSLAGAVVTVGEQTGSLVPGTAGTATFTITTSNVLDGTAGSISWFTSDSMPSNPTSAPATISYRLSLVSNNTAQLTFVTSTGTVKGKYYFKLTEGNCTTPVQSVWITDETATLGTQSSSVYNGTGGTVTLPITTTNVTGGATVWVSWYSDATGKTEVSRPSWLTASPQVISSNSGSVIISYSANAPAGTYYLRVMVGYEGLRSSVVPFTVQAKPDTLGKTWTTVMLGDSSNSVAYGNGTFVTLATTASKGYYSTDGGATWTASSTANLSNYSWRLAYGNGVFVGAASGYNKFLYSTDGGKNWLASSIGNYGVTSIAYGNGKFVAVGPMGYSLVSTDGIHWTISAAAALPYSSPSNVSVTYLNGTFCTVAPNSAVLGRSTDGLTWTSASVLPSSDYWWGLATDGTGAMVVTSAGSNGACAYSTDSGATWTASTLPKSSAYNALAYGAGNWVALGANAALSTDNGATWTEQPSGAGSSYAAAYGGGSFVTVGTAYRVLYSK